MLIASAEGARDGRHLCQFYGSDVELRLAVRDFVRSGLASGELVVHVTGTAATGVLAYLTELGVECEDAHARRQLRILSLADLTTAHDSRDSVLATLVGELTRTLEARERDGFRTARMVSEVDRLFGAETVEQVIARERLGDDLIAAHPMTGLCLYDRRLHERDLLRLVEAAHAASVSPVVPAYGDDIVTISMLEDAVGIRVVGELDISNRRAFSDVLSGVVPDDSATVVVELSGLSFIDVGGLGVLAETAVQHPDRTLVLVSPGGMLIQMLRLTGWDQLSNLVLERTVPRGGDT